MCGICGIIELDGPGDDFQRRIGPMVESLRHRGPDQSGTWLGRSACLGHARLSIIDVSEGRQPLSNEDESIWICYNGEVYNFPQLHAELVAKGHRFRTRTDTEVIVHLYEEEGVDCLRRLRGMFAFALWDARRQRLLLARDPLGVKPLYYRMHNGRLLFGSEIKAILAHGGIPRAVREDALSDYLTFLYVPSPKTMFRGIDKLPAGHWLTFDATGVRTQPYWDLTDASPLGASRQEVEHELLDRLSESVRMQLVSDVPLGAFLSGGVDSSAVVAMMSQAGQSPLVTASVGFEESRYNELPHARRVADRYGTTHYEQVVRADAVSVLDRLSWHYDEPFADYSAVPTYYVSKAAREHVTVALSGDGGDENFGGYRRYRLDLFERSVRRWLPPLVRRWCVGPLGTVYPKADWLPRPLRAKITLQNIAADPADAYCRSVGFLTDQQKQAFFTPDLRRRLADYRSAEVIRHHMARAPGGGLAQLLYTDLKTYLVDDILTKVDRASMAVSLEVRVPLLDHTFVEFAHRVPADMKIQGTEGKVVLKSALRDHLDHETLYRPKQGFTPPVTEWLRGELREMVSDVLLSPRAMLNDYLDPRAIRSAWHGHQSGLRDNTPLLWALLMFELWGGKWLGGGS
ncbi:MAG: asparagine synthase (glutamine-hydrolyzing) [Patescibacteria group bacterium]|nr:asparagine synthase (glutamine-hydrolyzing) [Patescibacteria group bacterium]